MESTLLLHILEYDNPVDSYFDNALYISRFLK